MNLKTLITSVFLIFALNSNAQDSLNIQVPTKVLLKKVNQHSFSISPNGKYFVEVIENNIENDIVVIDIDNYKLFQRIPIGRNKIQNVYWLSSDRLIYESQGEIIAIDIDGTNSKTLVSNLGDRKMSDLYSFYKNIRLNAVASLWHQNENEILIETYDYKGYSSIKRVNVFTGQKITVINGNLDKINKWVLDSDGNIRFGVKFDDDNYKYFIKDEVTNKWEPFYLKLHDKDILMQVAADSYLSQEISFEGFGSNNNIIYLTSNTDSDKRKLFAYNISDRKIEEVLFENVNCDINDPHGKGVSFIFDYSNGELAGIRYEGIVPNFKWFSSSFRQKHQELKNSFPKFINDILGSDSKSERLLIHQWSDTSEGNIGIYNTLDKTYAEMFYFNEELDGYKLSRTKPFVSTSRDGYQVPCYYNPPINYTELSPAPLVVIPHGGPWARDYWGLDIYAQYFATRGYGVLRVNFRGSTGFGKKHVMAGVNSIDEVMINDIADAAKFTASQYNMDKNKIFIFGHSYGGYATYMSLLRYPDLYASGAALSAPTDIKQWIKTQKKEKNYFSYEFWKTVLGDNSSKYLSKISPINFVNDFSKPLLIFHGKQDAVVSVEHTEKMVEAMREANKSVKYEILRGEGHSINDGNSVSYILDSANKFFNKSVSEN